MWGGGGGVHGTFLLPAQTSKVIGDIVYGDEYICTCTLFSHAAITCLGVTIDGVRIGE
jgi:hypothetical protein